jgi:hypothetical protein
MTYHVAISGRRVLIHDGSCSYCNNGKGIGIHRTFKGRGSAKWSPPFTTIAEAEAYAREQLGSNDDLPIALCRHCMSELAPPAVRRKRSSLRE